MSKLSTLEQLAAKRIAFKNFERNEVAVKVAEFRAALIAEEVEKIEDLVARAYAEGATYADIKRAYGSSDHATIKAILAARADRIVQHAEAAAKNGQWFEYNPADNTFAVKVKDYFADVKFEVTQTGKILFASDDPLWDAGFTEKNLAVDAFDGIVEGENEYTRELADHIRRIGLV